MWRRVCCLDSDVSNDGGVFVSKNEQTKKGLPYFFIGVASQDRLMGGVWIREGRERSRGGKFNPYPANVENMASS